MSADQWDPASAGRRAKRFFRPDGRRTGGHEGIGQGGGGAPPDGIDARLISARIVKVSASRGRTVSSADADGIAAELVRKAREAVNALHGGGSVGNLGNGALIALEAVLHVRGRPAVRILDAGLERPSAYPGGEEWTLIVDEYEEKIITACNATAAVRVADMVTGAEPWVQGTAWMIGPNLAVTNRHVLFPPMGGVGLVRRVPGKRQATLKQDYAITLDFAFDSRQAPRQASFKVVAVPFVTGQGEELDLAILQIETQQPPPARLALSKRDAVELERLYVVGHPGVMSEIPEEVQAVFGTPDARKRVSFGRRMEELVLGLRIAHDASTIGGYSGGCVIDFSTHEVAALHYWGDSETGNLAFTASSMLAEPELVQLLG